MILGQDPYTPNPHTVTYACAPNCTQGNSC